MLSQPRAESGGCFREYGQERLNDNID